MKRAPFFEIINLNMYWLGLSFMWSSLHVIILPAVLLHMVPDSQKNTYLGLLTFGGLVIAMIVQPISGALSDGWTSRWGRRRPLIGLGTAFDFIFLACLGWAGGLGWLLVGYLGLQLTSNIAHGPAQGLLPDRVPPEQLGKASGVKNLMDMAGLVAASLLMGRLVDPDVLHPIGPVALVALLLAAGAAFTLFGVREAPALTRPAASTPVAAHRAPRLFARLKALSESLPRIEAMRHSLRSNKPYAWLIASRFFFLLGIYDIQVFAQYYVRDVLKVSNPVQLTGDLLAAITLALIAFALTGGWLGDRYGHKRVLTAAGMVGALGCLLLLWARTPLSLLAFGAILGAGTGLFLTSNWALATKLAPAGEAGMFLGLTNLATAGSGAVARLSGPLIDLLNNAQPGAFWGYTAMFLFGAACTAASAVLLRGVTTGEPRIAPAAYLGS